jgi:hypothetical protein
MFKLKHLTIFLFLILGSHSTFSQLGFSHEIGVIVGPVQFRSDYGVRASEQTNIGNSGYGIGLIHYINFSYRADCNCYSTDTYFNDHFKLRSEISLNKTKLDFFGQWAEQQDNAGAVLRSHSGEANNFDIGMQLEYFPLSIRSFQGFAYRVAPFFSLGTHYTSYNPRAYRNEVRLNNPTTFPIDPRTGSPYWGWQEGSINPESGSTWSVVTSVGARYKLTPLSDLMIDLRWQYYFSDWIDGVNHQLDSNKHNDWLVWLNFGYIYYLD